MEWQQAFDRVKAIGETADENAVDLFEAGLALGLLDVCEPGEKLSVARCREAMATMIADLRSHPQATSQNINDLLAALRHVFVQQYDFMGDDQDYDNLENANLIRVMERRRGLPVALGIICLHLADQMGWDMHGLNFPGHFLIRFDWMGQRAILDPFARLAERSPGDLRLLVKTHRGRDAEMSPVFFEAVSKRSVLLRLQNNIKMRMLQHGDVEPALKALNAMRLMAPREPELLREQAVLSLSLGKFIDSIAALEQSLGLDLPGELRAETTALLEELKRKLH